MSDPVRDLKRELLAAAERRQERAIQAGTRPRRWLGHSHVRQGRHRRRLVVLAGAALVVAVASASAFGTVRDLFFGERRTARMGCAPTWSPDGRRIAFMTVAARRGATAPSRPTS